MECLIKIAISLRLKVVRWFRIKTNLVFRRDRFKEVEGIRSRYKYLPVVNMAEPLRTLGNLASSVGRCNVILRN